jgi:hypothetical protein
MNWIETCDEIEERIQIGLTLVVAVGLEMDILAERRYLSSISDVPTMNPWIRGHLVHKRLRLVIGQNAFQFWDATPT